MTQKTYYFVEDFNSAISYSDGTVVPLNPHPLFELGRRGISYSLMESFYNESELRSNEADFFKEEVAWIDRWDVFLNRRIEFSEEHGLRLARMYYNRLKFFVNALIIQSVILNSMVKKIGTNGKIVYIKKENLKPSHQTMHDFKYDEKSLCFEVLLPLVCKKYDVSFEFKTFKSEGAAGEKTISSEEPNPIREWAKKAKDFYKFEKWGRLFAERAERNLNVFFVHSGSAFLDPVIKDLVKKGVNVFARSESKITKLSSFLGSAVFDLSEPMNDPIQQKIEQDCAAAGREIETSAEGRELISWVSQKCGVDVADFITPYLVAFVAETCPELLSSARKLEKFYSENSIQYVFSHTNADHASKSSLLGAQIQGRVKSVGLQHCWDPFIDRMMHLTENDTFDYYFTMDDMSEKKYAGYNQNCYVKPSRIFQSPHYLEVVKSKAAKSKKTAGPYRRVLYIPTKLAAVHTRCFNCMVYPILWYLEFQKDILAYFASRPEIEFVYKQPMIRAKFVKESVIPYLAEKNYPNVKVETKPVMDCFGEVDAVIMDRPTTAFSEALMSGLPVLALYPDFVSNMYDPESFKLFGKSFQSFKDSKEAAQRIEQFLASSPEAYSPQLKMHASDIAEILTRQPAEPHSEPFSSKPAVVGSR